MPNFRYGGRARVDFRQIGTNVALPAALSSGDFTLDVSDSDFIAVIARADFSPSTPVAADFDVTLVPDTQDGAFMSAAGQLTTMYAASKGVTVNSIHMVKVYDVRPFSSVKYRYLNANATAAAVAQLFVSKALATQNN